MTDNDRLNERLDATLGKSKSQERQEAHQEIIDRLDQIINLLDKIASNTY